MFLYRHFGLVAFDYSNSNISFSIYIIDVICLFWLELFQNPQANVLKTKFDCLDWWRDQTCVPVFIYKDVNILTEARLDAFIFKSFSASKCSY